MTNLSEAQQAAVDFIVDGKSMFALGGYAGTGKTLTAATAARALGDRAILMAPTNKAAAVLAKATGMPAMTIHKRTLIAFPVIDDKGDVVGVRFEPGTPELKSGSVAIIDEASMMGGRLWDLAQEALAGDVPVALIGDPFQLPPVNDTDLFHRALDHWPSITLTDVYRQAEGSEVLDYATALRDGDRIPMRKAFQRMHPTDETFLRVLAAGEAAIITHTNEIRMAKIKQVRRALYGDEITPPQVGEVMIAYASDPTHSVVNGFTYEVVDIRQETAGMRFSLRVKDVGGISFWVEWDMGMALNASQKQDWWPSQGTWDRHAPLTWSYAITAHAAQGSQWPFVLVEQREITDDETARWVYTAVTRAQQGVFVL